MEISVQDCGANGDGTTYDTQAIQRAIDNCYDAGGGRVVVEPGTYLTGTIWLRDNVELTIRRGATLQGSTDPAHYEDFTADGFRDENAAEGNSKCLIAASEADNIAITGGGEINGAGPAFYDTDIPKERSHYEKPDIPRPRLVLFYNCRNVRLEGIDFVDSPCWSVWLVACEHVTVDGIRIVGDQKMINNDGLDIDSCRNVTVSNSFFQTGDDCIVVRAIQPVLRDDAICEHVTVTNCVLNSTCQGIRVGCPSDNIIRHCVFSNLVISGKGTGINIDNPQRYVNSDGASLDLHDVLFSDITIESGRVPIRIFVENGVHLERLSNITFSNIRATGQEPLRLIGNETTPIKDVQFNNITADINSDRPIVCHHCQNIDLNNVKLSSGTTTAK